MNKVLDGKDYINKCECGKHVVMGHYVPIAEGESPYGDGRVEAVGPRIWIGFCDCGNIFRDLRKKI